VALSGLGRFTAAIKVFDRALEINPADGEYWYSRGLVSDKLEKYDEALISYENAICVNPDNHQA
jgi:tetratricopeptide (TPR) repeat protein